MTHEITKTCICGAPMTIRENSANQQEFWGQTRWPDRTKTQKLDESTRMIRAGVPTLFDEEADANELF